MYDYDSIWALQIQGGYPGASHKAAIQKFYQALFRAGVGVDIVKPGDDISGYKLVFTPHLHVLPDSVAQGLVSYVRAGGVLVADCRTGVKDATNLAYPRTLPGKLSPALGIRIDEYEGTRLGINDDDQMTLTVRNAESKNVAFTADKHADWITPTTAEVVAVYDEWHLKPYAAMTRNQYGEGVAWYVGTLVKEDAFYDGLIDKLLQDAGVDTLIKPPYGVEAMIRERGNRRLLVLINHTDQEKSVSVPAGKRELLTDGATEETLTLGVFGVAVIEL